MEIIQELKRHKPVLPVYGNIDGPEIRNQIPENLHFEREGKRIWITHIAGSPPRYTAGIRTLLAKHQPDLLVCGHSHILKIISDRSGDLLYLNPGAAGRQGFHRVRTLIRFDLKQNHVQNMQVIELGSRSD